MTTDWPTRAGRCEAIAESALDSLQIAATVLREIADELADTQHDARYKAFAASEVAKNWLARGREALEDKPHVAVARPVMEADFLVEIEE
jgi:hypothetical protein